MRAVKTFETFEQQQESLEMPAFQAIVLPVERMSNAVGDLVLFDELRNAINVAGHRLKLGVLIG